MHLPTAIESITVNPEVWEVPYPPLGFYAFAEHQLGNGDVYGLYWPIGHEDREPIVGETYHDEWSLKPHFSSLDRFLAAAGDDDDAHVDPPDPTADPESPTGCVQRAREAVKTNNVEGAIRSLEAAISLIPEYAEAQSLLFAQYRRLRQDADAIRAAIQAIISPPCFGLVSPQLTVWLSRQTSCPPDLESDPIWNARSRLSLKFGGVKQNDDYVILRAAIEQYLDESAFVKAMTLMQKYGEHMHSETVSFQERYGFVAKEFVEWQRKVATSEYGTAREL